MSVEISHELLAEEGQPLRVATALEPKPTSNSPPPDKPVVRISPNRSWLSLHWHDLWTFRELLYFLAWRDIKVRYKQAALGAAWAVLQPLLTMLLFTLFFGELAGLPSDNIPYPIFAYAGLLPYMFFANSVTASGNSLIGSANLITKVYFPRLFIPAAAVVAGLVDFAIAFGFLGCLMAYYAIPLNWSLLLLPILVVMTTVLALAVGLGMAALNVQFRDVRYALPFVIQLWMFATPIIYPASMVPERWRWVLALNPLTGLIEGYRSCLFHRAIDFGALATSGIVTILLLIGSTAAFQRLEKRFADII